MITIDINNILSKVNNAVWGPAMLALLLGTGIYLTIKMRFFQVRKLNYVFTHTLGNLKNSTHKKKGKITPFQAVSTALAGTIGTGSVAGVATAIVTGGPGSIFWMWVSAFFGAATKYAEIMLSLEYRERTKKGKWIGGPAYYIKNGLKNQKLAFLFAAFTLLACMGMGNTVQSNSIAEALSTSSLSVDKNTTAVILMTISGVVILGGVKKIASTNEKLVPIMALFYVLCSIVSLVLNYGKIPQALTLIIDDAFDFKAIFGGGVGYGIANSVKTGFAKGVFSNEAGLGSAPIAHACADTENAQKHALWGIFEVYFTTFICTVSALVILCADVWNFSSLNGSALCVASFNEILPGFGGGVVTTATVLFALSTILGWAYYGEISVSFIFKNNNCAIMIFRIIYVLAIYVGAVSAMNCVWQFSEIANALMAIPNIIAIICLRNKIIPPNVK